MITIHQYLDQYPIPVSSHLLILGTIHPHNTGTFQVPFFYGNRNSIWNLLSDAFPDELQRPLTLNEIRAFLDRRHIGISDTIRQCYRKKPNALDQNLVPEILHHDLLQQIRKSKIQRILCTSGFGVNNAFRLFYERILGLKLNAEIRANRKVSIDPTVFGRPVEVVALYSPSGAANVGLSKSPVFQKVASSYAGAPKPVYRFKVDYYKQQFSI